MDMALDDKILVIGSNSFSGSHFVDVLLKKGFSVIGISRSDEPESVFLPYQWRKLSKRGQFSFHRMDLNKDLDRIVELVDENQPGYIANFAAQGMVAQSWENPAHWLETNTVSAVNLHDKLRTRPFLKKYVQISTPEVYGSTGGRIKEHTSYSPSTPYAVSKAAADMSLMAFYKTYGFPVVFTRAANVYGPGQQLYRIIPRAVLSFLTGSKLELHGGGYSKRSFIHIRDVVSATMDIMLKGSPGEIFHLSTGSIISIRSLIELIATRMEVSFEDHVVDTGERAGKDDAYILDSAHARDVFGWQVKISLEQGIDETIDWVIKNLEKLKKTPWDYIHKQ